MTLSGDVFVMLVTMVCITAMLVAVALYLRSTNNQHK